MEQARHGDVGGATATIERISLESTRVSTLMQLATECAKVGQHDRARALLVEISRKATPADVGRDIMQTACTRYYLGELGTSRELFLEVSRGLKGAPDATTAPKTQLSIGDLEGALQSLNGLDRRGQRDPALLGMIGVCVEQKNMQRAQTLLNMIESYECKINASTALSLAYSNLGDRERSLGVIVPLIDPPRSVRPTSARAIAQCLTSLSKVERALAWISNLKDGESRAWGFLGAAEGLLPRSSIPFLKSEVP